MHTNDEWSLIESPESADQFVPLTEVIELMRAGLIEGKARSAHPPELTLVGVPIEDIARLRIQVGRAPSVNSNLFELSSVEEAKAEVEANEHLARSVALERDFLKANALTAERFCKAIFSHTDWLRVSRHILSQRLFFDSRKGEIGGPATEQATGQVNLESERCYRLTLKPTKVNAETREVTAYLFGCEGTCPLFSAKDHYTRRVLLNKFADDTFELIATCVALEVSLCASVYVRIKATASELRYSGEVDQILEMEVLASDLKAATRAKLGDLFSG